MTLALAHGVELSESLAGTVHGAGAVALIVRATLAVRVSFIGAIDDHAGAAVAITAGSPGGAHAWIVGIEHHIDFAGSECRAFGYDVVAQLMHLTLVLVGLAFGFDRAKKVGQVLVLIAHIPTLVGEFLVGEIDAGEFLLKFFGVELPGSFNGGGGKDHRIGRKGQRGGEDQDREESGRAGHGALEV